MNKIKLNLDSLAVETFTVVPDQPKGKGTVHGQSVHLYLTDYHTCNCETLAYCGTAGSECTNGPGDTCWDECVRSNAPWNPCWTQLCTEWYPCA